MGFEGTVGSKAAHATVASIFLHQQTASDFYR